MSLLASGERRAQPREAGITRESLPAPHHALKVFNEPGVAQNLELLADFFANVAVVGMQFSEAFLETVGIYGAKLRQGQ